MLALHVQSQNAVLLHILQACQFRVIHNNLILYIYDKIALDLL